MTDGSRFSPAKPHFFQPLLPGFQSHLNIPVKFFSKHIEGKHEGKTVKLISDASERTWNVKMEGHRLTDGWKEFAKAHALGIDDFVVCRHEGDMLFHVTAFGTSCCEIQYAPPYHSHDKDDGESDGIGESSGKEKGIEEVLKTESDESSSCFVQSVTAANLLRGSVSVPIDFARRNGLDKGRHEIVLMNQEGMSWESEVKSWRSGLVFICRNWRCFCTASKLEAGDSFQFKLLHNTETPVFQLCRKIRREEDSFVDETERSRFVKITPTPNSLELGKQHLPVKFTKSNSLQKPRMIILVDKHKVEWSMKLKVDINTGVMYIMGGKGWKSFCLANEVVAGESLTLELIRGGNNPLLKFCSKLEKPSYETEARAQKRARV